MLTRVCRMVQVELEDRGSSAVVRPGASTRVGRPRPRGLSICDTEDATDESYAWLAR